ncbi:family 78 glycoside hydrolase catalytic domain [Streptomyces sp. NPDC058373]|uniref:family 78 glycoside hydrolase catalytic domain n=1 Tax=unclassified Streptomyces TaxID=2593676 RepID=UPI00364DCAFD
MTGSPHALTTNSRSAPFGIGTAIPRFAWRTPEGTEQDAYQIEVTSGAAFTVAEDRAATELVWQSGIISGAKPFGIAYGGAPLLARTRYLWRVRVFQDGLASDWSEPAAFETGVLAPDHLTARWISAPPKGPDDRRALYFKKEISLPAPVVRGRAYTSALGWYRLFVNREDITGQELVPRWTPFDEQVEYQVYDVTDAFGEGANVIGMVVGDGRYRGTLGYGMLDARYGDRIGVLGEIVLDLADGTRRTVTTDGTWNVGRGRIRTADPVFGEHVDLRIEAGAWLEPGATLEEQTQAVPLPPHDRVLVAEDVERVRETGRRGGSVRTAPSGAQIIDFGQNFTGVAALTLRGTPGSTVTVRYGEVLSPGGALDTAHLIPKKMGKRKEQAVKEERFQRDVVILGETATEYCPSLTVRGFRYVSVEGADPLGPDDAIGIVMSTDIERIARFESSDPRLEQLWSNAMWSLRSNFLDTPTDCPTRERSGWTGDIQVFGPTAAQLVDCGAYVRRYLANLAVEQYDDGRVPPFIPSERSAALGRHPMEYVATSTGWGDVSVMLPWTMYTYLGDEQVLRAQYDSARRWVDHLAARAAGRKGPARRFGRRYGRHERYIVDSGFHLGEWLRPGEGSTWAKSFLFPPAVVATAYFAHSAALLARIARVLGREADAGHYEDLHRRATEAWRAAFVRKRGARIGEDKQDDYVRALAFGLLPGHQRQAAADRLVELVEAAGDHLGTGFLSTPMLLPALVEAGRADVALRLLFQTTSPSWLAQIEQGATTIWEQWEGYDKDGNARDSHNHYAFGSVVRFLHEYVAGLAPAAPGYREILFAPVVGHGPGGSGPQSAGVEIDTPYGIASSRWHASDGEVRLDIRVPAGATGVVRLGGEERRVPAGEHTFTALVGELARTAACPAPSAPEKPAA